MSDSGSRTPDKERLGPNKGKQKARRSNPINLLENRNDLAINPMSARNRSGRGSNRNNGNNSNSDHGQEAALWENIKGRIKGDIVTGVNAEEPGLRKIVALDKELGAMDPDKIKASILKETEDLQRAGLKINEPTLKSIYETIEELEILGAVCKAKEAQEAAAAGPSKRGAARESAVAAASSLYDFDTAEGSSVASPAPAPRKFGERASTRDRERDRDMDSMPPKSDSVEPQGSVSTPAASGTAASRSRVVFSKGESVAFKPKAVPGEPASDWILGEVAQVLGEGKSRRYKVLDIEPEDQSKQKEYRTSASSMIPIAAESAAGQLPDWEARTTVLALYPLTTTFYKAEVHSMDGRTVNLKFEGENDSSTLQQVERRFVIEYRP